MSNQVKVWDAVEFYLGPDKKVEFEVNTSGNVEIKDASGNIIGTLDAANRKLTIPSGSTFELASGVTLTATDIIDSAHYAADSIDKEHLASEVYAIEPVCFSGVAVASKTYKIYKCWSACTVVRVCYFTSQAIGTVEGIDVLDGGTDGNGTGVIDACSNNLNGLDFNDLTTPYALSAGDYLHVKTDALVASSFISVIVLLKVPLGAAS